MSLVQVVMEDKAKIRASSTYLAMSEENRLQKLINDFDKINMLLRARRK